MRPTRTAAAISRTVVALGAAAVSLAACTTTPTSSMLLAPTPAQQPGVARVEPDRIVRASDVEANATWALDRVDQSALPLSGTYTWLLYTGSLGGAQPTPTDPPPTTQPPPGADLPPVASFTVSCPRGRCTFDAGTSADDHGIASYTWEFGDGSTSVTSTTFQAAHIYRSRGTYTVTLTVTDTAGQSTRAVRSVSIKKVG